MGDGTDWAWCWPCCASLADGGSSCPGVDAADPPAFGDVLEYVVTAVNTGDATAYDTNFVDTLPVQLTLEEGSVPTASIDGVPVPGFVAAH